MTPAEYREGAQECRQAMRGATSSEVRAELDQLARRWEEAAERAEQYQHLRFSTHVNYQGEAPGAPKRRSAAVLGSRAPPAAALVLSGRGVATAFYGDIAKLYRVALAREGCLDDLSRHMLCGRTAMGGQAELR